MKVLAAATAALMLTAGVAEAGRLITGPATLGAGTFYDCALAYWGPSTAPIGVIITAKRGAVLHQQQRFSVTGKNSSARLVGYCEQGCEPVSCSFSFSAPPADFRASVCVAANTGTDEGRVCLPAN